MGTVSPMSPASRRLPDVLRPRPLPRRLGVDFGGGGSVQPSPVPLGLGGPLCSRHLLSQRAFRRSTSISVSRGRAALPTDVSPASHRSSPEGCRGCFPNCWGRCTQSLGHVTLSALERVSFQG